MSWDNLPVDSELKREMLNTKQALGLTWTAFLQQCFEAWKEKKEKL